MKGVLPWLVRWTRHAGINRFLSCLGCSSQPRTKYFFPHFISPHRRDVSPVSVSGSHNNNIDKENYKNKNKLRCGIRSPQTTFYVSIGAMFQKQLFKTCSTFLFWTSTLKEKFEETVEEKFIKRSCLCILLVQHLTRFDPLVF